MPVKKKKPKNHTESYWVRHIYEGITVNALSQLTGISHYHLQKRLGETAPIGSRGENKVYDIQEALAAAYLELSSEDGEEGVPKLSANQQKAFWESKLRRQQYMVDAGILVPADEMLMEYSRAVGKFVSGINLMADQIDRLTGLTKDQRRLINEAMDSLLEQLREDLKTREGDSDD